MAHKLEIKIIDLPDYTREAHDQTVKKPNDETAEPFYDNSAVFDY